MPDLTLRISANASGATTAISEVPRSVEQAMQAARRAAEQANRAMAASAASAARAREQAEQQASRATEQATRAAAQATARQTAQVVRAWQQAAREEEQAARQAARAQEQAARQAERAQAQAAQLTARLWQQQARAAEQGAQAMARAQEKAAQEAERAQSRAAAQSARAWANAGRGLTSALHGAAGDAGGLLHGMLGVVGQIEGAFVGVAGKILGTLGSVFESLIGTAERFGLVAGGALTALVAATASAGVGFNSFKESTRLTFEVLFHSASKADETFEKLKRFADITPFDTREVIEAGKELATFGLDIDRYLTVAGNLSAAFNKPLSETVELLGRAKAGIFNIREFAPLGITREKLQGVGVKFSASGETQNRQQLLPAVEQIANRDFGGLIQRQATTLKGLQSTILPFFTEELPGKITEGLTAGLKGAAQGVLAFIERIRGSEGVMRALSVPFDLLGKAAEWAAAKLPAVADWLGRIATRENVVNVLASVGAAFQTLAAEVMQFLSAVTGGRSFSSLWEAFSSAAEAAIDAALRTWEGFTAALDVAMRNLPEVGRILALGMVVAKAAIEATAGAAIGLMGIIAADKIAGVISGVVGIAAAFTGVANAAGLAATAAAGVGAAVAVAAAAAIGVGISSYAFKRYGSVQEDIQKIQHEPGLSDEERRALAHSRVNVERREAFGGTTRYLPGGAEKPLSPREQELIRGVQERERQRATPPSGTAARPETPTQQPAGTAGPVTKTGAGDYHFTGPLGILQDIGAKALGTAGTVANEQLLKLIEAVNQITSLPTQMQQAFMDAYQRGGIKSALDQYERFKAGNTRALNTVLGPAGAVTSAAPYPPAPQLYGRAATGETPTAPTPPDAREQAKAAKEFIHARQSWWDGQIEWMRLVTERAGRTDEEASEVERLSGVADRARAEAEQVGALLRAKAADMGQELALATDRTQYFQLLTQQGRILQQADALQDKATAAARTLAKAQTKAAEEQIHREEETLKLQAEAIQERVKTLAEFDPLSSREVRWKELIPSLVTRFRDMAGRRGVDPASEADRQKTLEGIRREVYEAAAGREGHGEGALVTVEALQTTQRIQAQMMAQFARSRGRHVAGIPRGFDPQAGLISLVDPKVTAWKGYLDQIEKQGPQAVSTGLQGALKNAPPSVLAAFNLQAPGNAATAAGGGGPTAPLPPGTLPTPASPAGVPDFGSFKGTVDGLGGLFARLSERVAQAAEQFTLLVSAAGGVSGSPVRTQSGTGVAGILSPRSLSASPPVPVFIQSPLAPQQAAPGLDAVPPRLPVSPAPATLPNFDLGLRPFQGMVTETTELLSRFGDRVAQVTGRLAQMANSALAPVGPSSPVPAGTPPPTAPSLPATAAQGQGEVYGPPAPPQVRGPQQRQSPPGPNIIPGGLGAGIYPSLPPGIVSSQYVPPEAPDPNAGLEVARGEVNGSRLISARGPEDQFPAISPDAIYAAMQTRGAAGAGQASVNMPVTLNVQGNVDQASLQRILDEIARLPETVRRQVLGELGRLQKRAYPGM